MGNNCWARTSIKYYVDWKVEIEDLTSNHIFEYKLDLKDKLVYIALDSKSIGDTIAWFPYVEEFRKKHECNIVCSTFHNDWFKSEYPHIKFIEPGEQANGIIAMYTIGLFYKDDNKIDENKHPLNPITQPLQKVASDILGLKYKEIKPKMKQLGKVISRQPYVAIGFHSTAQTKYWNNPTGWQEVVDYINSRGYEAIILAKEEDGYMGNKFPTGATIVHPDSIDSAMEYINGSQFFIGISSGLSWLAWALEKKTVLISGFTEENLEFNDCIRIINKSVCNGCWSRHRFDPGNWNWCPEHEKTARQFECTKTITGKEVISRIKNLFI
jgi:autotransporter strand-loop-strand O-heptosyltransferase